MKSFSYGVIAAVLLGLGLSGAKAANQYWDPNTTAGYQQGDGVWSAGAADTNWTAAGTAPRTAWAQTNAAFFSSPGYPGSEVTLSGSVTASLVTVQGSNYSFIVDNAEWVSSGGLLISGKNNKIAVRNASRAAFGNAAVTVGSGSGGRTNSLVIDGNGVTGGAVVTNIGTLTVGSAAGADRNGIVVTNGGWLFTAGAAVIGTSCSGNYVRVEGPAGSLWSAGNAAVTVGSGAGVSNLLVIDGKGTLGGAILTNVLSLTVGGGSADTGSTVIVANKGVLYAGGAIRIGNGGSSETDASLVIAGGGVVRTTNNTSVGYKTSNNYNGWRNSLIVRDAESLFDGGGARLTIADLSAVALGLTLSNSRMLLDGGTITNVTFGCGVDYNATAYYRENEFGSYILVTNGGRMFCGAAYDTQFHITGGGNPSYYSLNSTDIVTGAGTLWDNGGKGLIYASSGRTNFPSGTNMMTLDDGALMTNVGALSFAAANAVDNRFIVTNGARLYSTNGAIGSTASALSIGNKFTVTGSRAGTNSLWDLGGGSLKVGSSTGTNNYLFIDKGAVVDNAGAVTVAVTNWIVLSGGTLDVASITDGSLSPFIAGDGVQTTLVKIAAGPSVFSGGLTVNTNATLLAGGTIAGGSAGVTIANGAVFSPGVSGPGSMTLTGSNFTWNAGGTYVCQITDVDLGPGAGWDVVNVSSQVVFNGSSPNFVIKMDAMGAPAAHFNPQRDYNLRILSGGGVSGYAPSAFTVDTNAFPGGVSPWTVTNANNSLYLVYRGSGIVYTPSSKWNDPNNGNWDVAGNWTPNGQPANDGTAKLEFAGSGAAYASTNNLGTFLLNKILLTGTSGAAVTNLIGGDTLVFTNADARIDYSGSASYLITNRVQSATNLVFGGNGFGGNVVVQTNIVTAGGLTKQGPWTLELKSPNTIGGPLLIDSVDGMVKAYTNSALGTANAVTVSNGTLWTATAGSYVFASAGGASRRGLITGAGTVWTNSGGSTFYVANGATNATLTVADGALLHTGGKILVMASDTAYNKLIITNGGRVISGAGAIAPSSGADNNLILITGTNSLWNAGGQVTLNNNSGGNRVVVENGGTLTNANLIIKNGMGGVALGLVVRNGGRAFLTGLLLANLQNGSPGKVLVTGNESLLVCPSSVLSFSGIRQGLIGNLVTVDDGATVSNGYWQISNGANCSRNGIVVTNGGRLFCSSGTTTIVLTNNCMSNTVAVVGENSLWNNGGQSLTVVNNFGTSSWNGVTLAAGGTMTNVGTLLLANSNAFGASSNYVIVSDATLQANTLTSSNAAAQYLTMGGQSCVTLNNLIATNLMVFHNGGTLNAKNMTLGNGAPFIVGDTTTFGVDTDSVMKVSVKAAPQPATLNLLPGGSSLFANGLVITNLAALTGSGMIQATATVSGALSPGTDGIGAIVNDGDFTLKPDAGTWIDLAANTTPGAGWDYLAVTNGALQLNGSLSVLLVGGFMPTNTQSFVIMTNLGPLTVSGSFANTPGSQVPACTNLGGKAVGYFRVVISDRSVVLDTFSALRSNPGSVIFIR